MVENGMNLKGPTHLDRITINPDVMDCQPCIRGLRIPVSLVVKLIASGKSIREILDDYPELEEDVKQALEYAAWATAETSIPMVP